MSEPAVINHEELPSGNGEGYRRYRMWGMSQHGPFTTVTEDGQYEHEILPEAYAEDDEPIQVAIGEYMEKYDIDPGKCHR